MRLSVRELVRGFMAMLLAVCLVTATSALAQDHVVTPTDLQKAAQNATDTKELEQQKLGDFLSSLQAQKALAAAHMDATQVKNAINKLDDRELSDLSKRAEKAQANFAAGRVSDRDLIWIIVGIAVVILIIVAVR